MAAPLLIKAAEWLSAGETSGLSAGVRAMTAGYTRGADSASALTDLRSYVAARLPATYAACDHVLAEVAGLIPEFQPHSMLDVGAGPGTASWAAMEAWPEIVGVTQLDCHPSLAKLAAHLCESAEHPALASATAIHADMRSAQLPPADLVVVAYALAELSLAEIPAVIQKAWVAAGQAVVLIEPGTPAGFARVALARQKLLELGAKVLAPCPHQQQCPLRAPDWCHFSVRLARTRLHMHAKQGTVPFEDEKFTYLAATRDWKSQIEGRVLAPSKVTKASIDLKLCETGGLKQRQVARRTPAAYKRAKKIAWGDALFPQDMEHLWPES